MSEDKQMRICEKNRLDEWEKYQGQAGGWKLRIFGYQYEGNLGYLKTYIMEGW